MHVSGGMSIVWIPLFAYSSRCSVGRVCSIGDTMCYCEYWCSTLSVGHFSAWEMSGFGTGQTSAFEFFSLSCSIKSCSAVVVVCVADDINKSSVRCASGDF